MIIRQRSVIAVCASLSQICDYYIVGIVSAFKLTGRELVAMVAVQLHCAAHRLCPMKMTIGR